MTGSNIDSGGGLEEDAADGVRGKLIASGVIAVIVGLVAAVSGVGIGLLIVAVFASVAAFWLVDSLLARSVTGSAQSSIDGSIEGSATVPPASQHMAPPHGGAPPITVQTPIAPPSSPVVEAEPASPEPPSAAPGVRPSAAPGARPSAAPAPVPDSASAIGEDMESRGDERPGARLDPALLDPDSVEIKANSQGKNRMMSIRIAKHGHTIGECEDAVVVDPRRALMAIGDGASASFGASLWAEALATQFVAAPPKPLSVTSFASWLADARSTLLELGTNREATDIPAGWWSEQGARQGAYSTVVGAAIMTDGDTRVATVMCLGDSCAFVLGRPAGARQLRRALPYEDASQFGSHPALLASMADRPHAEPSWTTVPMDAGDLLVLASDAVAEWLLADPRRFTVLDDADPQRIANRLIAERLDGRIVNDDLTLATLELAS
jgi:serine/threonine protein phosphatase PrpC